MLREGNFCQFKNVDSDVVENIQKEGIKSYKETGLGVQAESLQTQQLLEQLKQVI